MDTKIDSYSIKLNHAKLFLSTALFLPSRKAPTFWQLRETKLPLSGAVEQKHSTQTMVSKKKDSDHNHM